MVETDWDKLFREKLKKSWAELIDLKKSDIDKDLISKQLKSIANDFINTFQKEDCPIPVVNSQYYYSKFDSAEIPLGSFSFLIPHTLYTLADLEDKINLDSLFTMPVSWYTFLSYFYETILNIRKPLKETDVVIMSILTRYQPKETDNVIPFGYNDISKLAEKIGNRKKVISENTVGKRTTYLYHENILMDKFLINPWSVGYTLISLIYKKNYDQKMKEWDKWTKYKQFFMSNKILRIIRVPQHAENEFTIPKYVKSYEILEYLHSTNISQLNPKEKDSFNIPPNFEVIKTSDYIYTRFFKQDDVKWIEELLSMEYSSKARKETEFASLNKITKEKRLGKAFNFLDILSKEQRIRSPVNKTARRANLKEIEFLDFMRFFIKQNVIKFVTQIGFIDCNYRIGVFIKSLEKTVNEHPQLQLFIQNLLELPLIDAFIGDFIIAAYIKIPLKWVGAFSTYLNILMTYSDLQIEFGTHMALQSYLHPNTPFSEDITLTTYGMLYNPSFEYENST